MHTRQRPAVRLRSARRVDLVPGLQGTHQGRKDSDMTTFGPPAGTNWREYDRWETGVCVPCYEEDHEWCGQHAYGDDCPCPCRYSRIPSAINTTPATTLTGPPICTSPTSVMGASTRARSKYAFA